jgi:cation:H+ antiporter
MQALSTPLLVALFLLSTAIIWWMGIRITQVVDFVTFRFDLGEAFGGMVFLSIITNLPEIAITLMAAAHRNYDIAVSNILGGIAIQTVVLVLIDVFGVGHTAPLTWKGHARVLILEGLALIFILTFVLMGKQFPVSFMFFRSSPIEWIIFGIWLGSIYFISRIGKADAAREKAQEEIHHARHPSKRFQGGTTKAILELLIGAVIILFAGWLLEASGEIVANRFSINGVIFGGTILALCTALPEISTGIASAKIRDYNMAVSDIFGGNAFLPTLFLFASLIGGDTILPTLKPSDLYLTTLGIILTSIYMVGMLIPTHKQIFRMGIDSFVVLWVYLLGIVGLLFIL